MATEIPLVNPWLVAVWPGMGQVALTAGYYLLSKLDMYFVAEFSPRELFEVEHVEVKDGILKMGRLPRSRFFLWKDPKNERDIVVFLGDAQPNTGKYAFCHKLIEFAKSLGVERVFTFAAMATDMQPKGRSRVFGAATDDEGLAELKRLELDVVEDGNISGLNGVLLGVAAEQELRGACLLGEIPHIFPQFPFPKAALGVLESFCMLAGVSVDLKELADQADAVDQRLDEILREVAAAVRQQEQGEEEDGDGEEFLVAEEESISERDRQRLDQLFEQARDDRSKAYELKRELDRLDVFREYEDRFLDLFKRQE